MEILSSDLDALNETEYEWVNDTENAETETQTEIHGDTIESDVAVGKAEAREPEKGFPLMVVVIAMAVVGSSLYVYLVYKEYKISDGEEEKMAELRSNKDEKQETDTESEPKTGPKSRAEGGGAPEPTLDGNPVVP
jgi:hypothetical protein